MSSDDSPPIIRPIPRRPFDLNVAGPTPPPEEDDDDASAPPSPNPNDIRLLRATFLDPNRPRDASSGSLADADQQGGGGGGGSGSLSRAQSIMNLTASTLFGIYSPTTLSTAGHGSSGYYSTGTGGGAADRSEPGTPWGTGAESPLKRTAGVDAPTFALMKGRSKLLLRRRSTQSNGAARMPLEGRGRAPGVAGWRLALSLAARAALLFGLGTGYGLFVSRLHDRHKLTGLGGGASEGGGGGSIANPGLEWKYLLFWGVAGVVLGALLPWFDTVWDEMFGKGSRARARAARAREAAVVGGGGGADDEDEEDDDDEDEGEEEEDKGTSPSTDWALVIRGIGAFAGIVFAIRKLPWASTMQVSLTLALVNPFLWYLIDRSKSGFMLAATVGLTGSSILLGLNPAMMPTPAAAGAGAAYYDDDAAAAMGLRSNGSRGAATSETGAGGLVRHHHETIEAGIWMLSVLFCSCVCFGNIGRRLALDGSAAARGRWGGVR